MNRYEKLFGVDAKQDIDVNKSSLLDPRSDITSDHHYWEHILTNAKALFDTHKPVNNAGETSLFKILHGLRCGGARLEETKQAYKLHQGGEDFADSEEWAKIKQRWLNPVKDDLIALFKLCKIGRVVDGNLPEGVAEKFKRESRELHGVQNVRNQQQLEFGGR